MATRAKPIGPPKRPVVVPRTGAQPVQPKTSITNLRKTPSTQSVRGSLKTTPARPTSARQPGGAVAILVDPSPPAALAVPESPIEAPVETNAVESPLEPLEPLEDQTFLVPYKMTSLLRRLSIHDAQVLLIVPQSDDCISSGSALKSLGIPFIPVILRIYEGMGTLHEMVHLSVVGGDQAMDEGATIVFLEENKLLVNNRGRVMVSFLDIVKHKKYGAVCTYLPAGSVLTELLYRLGNECAKPDSWEDVEPGSLMPRDSVKVGGQQNLYVARLIKDGQNILGCAKNNGGVVEYSFPFLKGELIGAKELGGEFQVLQYKGDHSTLGYWYNWIKYSQRFHGKRGEMLRCGDSTPALWAKRPEGALLGYLDTTDEIARFSHDGISLEKSGDDLADMMILVREFKGGPVNCKCTVCNTPDPKPSIRMMDDHWADFRAGDQWPDEAKMIQAEDDPLDTMAGENPEQYVAMWHKNGHPVMGRAWNEGGKIAASFSFEGKEYKDNLGSVQILLIRTPAHLGGVFYAWLSYTQVFKETMGYRPVVVPHHKGDISPAVVIIEDKQMLGWVNLSKARASAGYGGREFVVPYVDAPHTLAVLCRRDKPNCLFIED